MSHDQKFRYSRVKFKIMEGTESEEAEGADDYMSEAFLQQLQDVRPGLLTKSRKRQRKIDDKQISSQKLPKQKRISLVENEKREQALATPLSTANKGFSMLQKMGYKKGTGLGKTGMSFLVSSHTHSLRL